jgi:serine/threonine protein kinase
MIHPSLETLMSLLEDRLEDPDRTAVAEHVDGCEACQSAIEEIACDDLAEWKAASRRTVQTAAVGPAYERIVRHAAQGLETLCPSGFEPEDLNEILDSPGHDGDLGALEQYRVRSVIGHGGMGIVFEAVDPALERTVALKVLRAQIGDSSARHRFVREAQAAARVKHDHVVTIFAVGNPPRGLPYLAMEYLPGPTLRALIVAHGRLAPRLAAELCAQVAEGVAAAHAAGLVHRDVKPNNVLLMPADSRSRIDSRATRSDRHGHDGCPWRAKVADFGLARPVEHSGIETVGGALCGTPAYLSPEQIRDPGVVDSRCDVYSLGVTLYEALTGEVPFRGSTPMVLQQAVNDEPRPPGRMSEGIPRDLETICLKAMAKEPDHRYATAQAFADDLRRWLRGEPILARPSSQLEKLSRWCRRNPRLAVLSGTVAALIVCTVVGSVTAALLIARAQRQTSNALTIAKDQRALALDTLNDLVSRVQTTLADRPGTLGLRQQILTKALDNLQRIARDAENGKIVDHNTIVAHQRIGDVLWISGRNDEARGHYRRSLELANTLLERNTSSDRTKRDVAWAHDALGVLDQHAFKLDAALAHYRAALELRDQAANRSPRDVAAQRERALAVRRLGDIASLQGNHALSRQEYQRALNYGRAATRMAPEDLFLRRDVLNMLRRLSWACVGLGDGDAAERNLREAANLLESLRTRDPANQTWRQEEAWLYQDLGTLQYQRKDYAGAVAQLEAAVAAQTILADIDPDHAESQWNLAQGENTLTQAWFAQGRYGEARDHALAASRILASLAQKHPSSTKYWNDASGAFFQLGGVEWRLDHMVDSQKAFERAIEFLRAVEIRGELQSAEVKATKALLEMLLATLPLRDKALESLEFVRTQPPALRSVLFGIRAYDLARAGRFADALATVDQARDFAPEDAALQPAFWFAIARTYGLIAAGLAKSPGAAERTTDQIRHCVASAKEALARCYQLSPATRGLATHEFELRSVQ